MEEREEFITPDYMDSVRELVATVSDFVIGKEDLKEMNFCVYYQHGRVGFMDLDRFAESTKAKLNVDGEDKTIAEIKNDIDKTEE